MHQYKQDVLMAIQLCSIALLAFFVAANATAQNSGAAAPSKDKEGEPDAANVNIYNGNITTDANGDAFVQLPRYFEALNRDFRYQLTDIGTFAESMVAEKINDNHFRIKTNLPNVEVSWQVTGVRLIQHAEIISQADSSPEEARTPGTH